LRPDFYAAIAYDAMDAIYHVVAEQHGVLDVDRTMQLLRAVRMEGPRDRSASIPQRGSSPRTTISAASNATARIW